MDASILLNADPATIARHLQASAAKIGTKEVTKDLLSNIATESLPPRVFRLWLAAGGDCEAIHLGLHFQDSKAVRWASISHFGRLFCTQRLEDVWNAIGGTTGVVGYLAAASVCDVKHFCNQIRRSATVEISASYRKVIVGELYRALRHMDATRESLQTPDQRPLSSIYHSIFPACSQPLILSVVDGKSHVKDTGSGKSTFAAHAALFRSRCLSELRDPSIEVDMKRVLSLLSISSNDDALSPATGMSANTEFALEVLEVLSIRTQLTDASRALSKIATPLFRRLVRRRCRPDTMVRAVLAYVAFAQQHISNRMSLFDLCSGPGPFLIKTWGRCPDQLEEALVVYLRLAPNHHIIPPHEWLALVQLVPTPMRVRLIRHVSRCDPITDSQMQWDAPLLLALPCTEARQTAERLITTGSKKLNECQETRSLLMIKLSKYEPSLLELATQAVEERKQEASRAREQPARAACVSSALQFAAASQCLELYGQTLLWTRKYVRDPLTALEIFRGHTFTSHESVGLLSGIPETSYDYGLLSLDQVDSNVRRANLIITECFETACLAQQEPGFKSAHWGEVLGLMRAVVKIRYERVKVLHDLSHEDIFEVVWRDTIEVCKTLELAGLDGDNASLNFNTLGGPLMGPGSWRPVLTEPPQATLQFLDTLAGVRDKLWDDHRRKHVPATLTLSEPYPRGLPLDCLVPVNLKECRAGEHLPYVMYRAERVVFMPQHTALSPQPTSDEATTAIGACVEDWPNALATYVYLSHNRQEAAVAAWKHAIGPLSGPRMTATEAFLFWSPIFASSLTDADLYGPWKEALVKPPPPQIPSAQSDDHPIEWSPESDVKSFEVKPRKLAPVVLDAMLNRESSFDKTMDSVFSQDPDSTVPARTLEPFWSRWSDPQAVSFTTQESLIAAAVLHISEANSLSPGILSIPFPSSGIVRFPSLYLDGDFLDREDPKKHDSFVWEPLARLSNNAPSTLLAHLTRALVDSSPHGQDRTPSYALKLLRVLVKGDRPQVALDLIQDMVLDRPEDSAWQRVILTEGLLNSLPMNIVEHFLRQLSAAMQQRFSERIHQKSDAASASMGPGVKITTVKMLAQLLAGNGYIDNTFASSTLISLLASARHIDVRVSVMESLLDILATSQNVPLCDTIIAAFETHCVPIMSGINERAHMSQEEWMSHDSNNLPKLHKQDWGFLPPMLSCVMGCVGRMNESMRQQIFDRILIPALLKNSETNERWVYIFMQRHGVALPAQPLPRAPTQLQFLVELMKWPAHIPAFVVDLWLDVLTTVMRPPPELAALNDRICKDVHDFHPSDVRHWCALWMSQTILVRQMPALMLLQEWHPVRDDGVTLGHIQSVVLKQTDVMLPLLHQTTENGLWLTFIRDLQPPKGFHEKLGLWHVNVKPLLQPIIDRVEALRTEKWQKKPDRSPATLPDFFSLRLWTLTPVLISDEGRDEALRLFASEITGLMTELGRSNRAYTGQYEALTAFVLAIGSSADRVKLALIFGSLDEVEVQHLDTAHDLKIDLARKLLESAAKFPPAKGLQLRAVAMVKSLAGCADERTRNVWLTLLQDRKRQGQGMAWYAESEGG